MKNFTLQEIKNSENFDLGDLYQDAPFTQASFYGDWQKNLGRTVKRFLINDGNKTVAYFQMVKYPLLLGKSYFYIPYGPVTKDFSEDFYIYLKQELKKIAKTEGAVFVRLDFTPTTSDHTLSKFFTEAKAYTYHSAYFQPRVEWVLDLEKSEDEILASMDKRTRYAIRSAEKREITTEIITKNFEKYFDIFYELMTETAKRNGFSLHQKNYYKNIFQNLHKTQSYLSIAKYGQKVLVVNLIVIFGRMSNYVFSGSSNEERARTPAYLAQWRAICQAKQFNCNYYNFGGVSSLNNAHKSWDGLTTFKKRFGGKELKHSNFFDVVVDPFWYHLYNFRKLLINTGSRTKQIAPKEKND